MADRPQNTGGSDAGFGHRDVSSGVEIDRAGGSRVAVGFVVVLAFALTALAVTRGGGGDDAPIDEIAVASTTEPEGGEPGSLALADDVERSLGMHWQLLSRRTQTSGSGLPDFRSALLDDDRLYLVGETRVWRTVDMASFEIIAPPTSGSTGSIIAFDAAGDTLVMTIGDGPTDPLECGQEPAASPSLYVSYDAGMSFDEIGLDEHVALLDGRFFNTAPIQVVATTPGVVAHLEGRRPFPNVPCIVSGLGIAPESVKGWNHEGVTAKASPEGRVYSTDGGTSWSLVPVDLGALIVNDLMHFGSRTILVASREFDQRPTLAVLSDGRVSRQVVSAIPGLEDTDPYSARLMGRLGGRIVVSVDSDYGPTILVGSFTDG